MAIYGILCSKEMIGRGTHSVLGASAIGQKVSTTAFQYQ